VERLGALGGVLDGEASTGQQVAGPVGVEPFVAWRAGLAGPLGRPVDDHQRCAGGEHAGAFGRGPVARCFVEGHRRERTREPVAVEGQGGGIAGEEVDVRRNAPLAVAPVHRRLEVQCEDRFEDGREFVGVEAGAAASLENRSLAREVLEEFLSRAEAKAGLVLEAVGLGGVEGVIAHRAEKRVPGACICRAPGYCRSAPVLPGTTARITFSPPPCHNRQGNTKVWSGTHPGMDYETPQFFRVMRYAREADRDVVDMVSGNPDWDPPSALREGLKAYADSPTEAFQYPPSVGLRDLREEIATRRGVATGQVLVTNGAGEANHLAMAAGLEAFPGAEVLLVDPVYPYYPGRASLLGADVSFVPTEVDGQLDAEAVRECASAETAVIVVNTPNNPLGTTYDETTMAALVDVAEARDALLVSDEVYDHFDYGGRFSSALAVDSPNRVVTNSFSKSMAITGWRVGYAVFPPRDGPSGDLFDRARTRHMLTTVTGSRPAQAAVLAALRETGPGYYERNRERLRERIEVFTAALDAAGAEFTRPDGGFYVMARFPDFAGSMENVERLVDEAGVAGMPGAAFGDSRADWLRFALVTPRVATAAERLADYFE